MDVRTCMYDATKVIREEGKTVSSHCFSTTNFLARYMILHFSSFITTFSIYAHFCQIMQFVAGLSSVLTGQDKPNTVRRG